MITPVPLLRRARRWRAELSGARADLVGLAVTLVYIGVAFVVGVLLRNHDVPLHAGVAPLLGKWDPHVGVTTPVAVAVAAFVVGWGPAITTRLSWRRLLPVGYAVSTLWVFSLGTVDGWSRLASRFTRSGEYLNEVSNVPPLHRLLPSFAGRIVHATSDNPWATQVAGHPPGALEFFVLLDRVGLSGGYWAAAVCMLAGSSACVAVAITVREVAGECVARAAAPFLVLVPAALWIGASADAMFLAVSAWGVALLAVATRRYGARGDLAAFGAGLLLGYTLYLSYGLVLLAPIAGAVLLARGRIRPGVIALTVVAAFVAAVTAGGFWWWHGYQELVTRYYWGFGGERPYSYWVWGDLAALLLCVGPAILPGIRRLATRCVTMARARVVRQEFWGLGLVVGGGVLAIAVATLSGLSKAEVERIWLPFALWLVPACSLLPRPRAWLALQGVAALLLQHLLLTHW